MYSSWPSIRLAVVALVVTLLSLPAGAEQVGDTIVSDGFHYRVIDDESVSLVAIDNALDEIADAVIPECVTTLDGSSFAVTTIGASAFAGSESLTTLSLPVTLQVIEDYAFAGCTNLTGSIVLPHGLKSLGTKAFAGCLRLTSLSLPSSLETLGDNALEGCTSLDTVFSHTSYSQAIVNILPPLSKLCVDTALVDGYSQFYDGEIIPLVNVDNEPHSANLCDVNRDGVVNVADVTFTYNNLLGYSDEPCDANGDGRLTSTDVTVIYNAMLEGNTSGVGNRGFCFVTYNPATGHAPVRIGDKIKLAVGEEMCVVAHDNEQHCLVPSFNIMSGVVPFTQPLDLDNGNHAIILNNKSYNRGTTTQGVMYFPAELGLMYYKDVQVEVARHVVTDTLRVLSIGNSFSLDALSYVPFIMKAVAPEVYLKLGIMYIGGGSLENFCNALDTTAFRYYWSHGAQPWDERLDVSLTEIIESQPWDVITLQQKSSISRDYSTYQPYLNQLIGWLDNHTSSAHEYAWLITPSYPEGLDRLAPDTTSVQMFERILQCVRNLQQDTGIEFLLPCGTAIQNARTTPLDSLGDLGHLFDYLHLQDGIPCLVEAYVATAALLARYGLSDRVWADTTWVDQHWLRDKNIQEINGLPVGMSEENRAIAKQCAIKALENPLSITVIE